MLKNLGFKSQLLLAIAVSMFILAIVTSLVTAKLSTNKMRDRILEEGSQLALTLAEQAKVPILYQNAEIAENILSGVIESVKDVVGVSLLTEDFAVLFSSGEQQALDRDFHKRVDKGHVFVDSQHRFWTFIAPVKIYHSPQRFNFSSVTDSTAPTYEVIGYVVIKHTKRALFELNSKILLYNFSVSIGFSIVLLGVLAMIASRLLKPIQYLAQVMRNTQSGKEIQQIIIHGPSDVREMFTAFNTMVEIIIQRERELVIARDKAFEFAKLKSEFSASVSHELRTPMNGVIGMLDILQESSLTGQEREYLNVAKGSAESLLTLINNILDFSKYESGNILLEFEKFDFRNIFDDVVVLLGPQSRKKSVELLYFFPADTPKFFRGDGDRIKQIIINLVSNAIKFTKTGFVAIEMESDITEKYDEAVSVKISVRDSGIGVASDKQELIFNAFSQADGSTTRKYGGTGLGLSICKQLVKLMHGTMGVDSQVGKGSNFWFTIGLVRENTSPLLLDKSTEKSVDFPNIFNIQRSGRVAKQVEIFLQYMGLESQQIKTTEAALYELAQLSELNLGAVLLVLDGDAAIDTDNILSVAKAKGANVSLIIYSFSSRDCFHEDGLVFLSKPLSFKRFYRAVKHLASPHDSRFYPQQSLQTDSTNEHSFSGTRVLVVDDNPVNTFVASSLLRSLQCDVDTAQDGIDCIKKFSSKVYDIILMDCNMPNMDGYQAARTIRWMHGDKRRIPIIASSANTADADIQKCLDSGMNDYLVKPFNKQALVSKLKAFTSH